MNQQFANNPAYVEYEGLLKRLHDLVASGHNDTPEVESIHDQMDTLEPRLSRREIDRLNGLSSDLYMLQGQEMLEATDLTSSQIGQAISIAYNEHDWEQVLTLLRKAPQLVSPDKVAYIRARAYEELGHLETSLLFMEYAAAINAESEDYEYFVVEKLQRLNRNTDALEYADRQMRSGHKSPSFRIQYAGLLFMSTQNLATTQAISLYDRAIEVLKAALPEARQDLDIPPQVVVMGYLALGSCYEGLDQLADAIAAYSQALEIDPNDVGALTLRGAIQAQNDLNSAFNDFELAVRNNAPDLAPYICLAYMALVRSNFQRCIELCRAVRGRTSEPDVLAVAYQWTAIAQYCSGTSMDIVVHNAQRASDFDPLNPQIQASLQFFESIAQDAEPPIRVFSDVQPVDVRNMSASRPDPYSLSKSLSLTPA